MFTGSILIKRKSKLKNVSSCIEFMILESFLRAERVWSLIFKIYIIRQTQENSTFVLIFLIISTFKLFVTNIYNSYHLSNLVKYKHKTLSTITILINLLNQTSYVLLQTSILLCLRSRLLIFVQIFILS